MEFEVKYAKTDGSGFDVMERVSTREKLIERQQIIWEMAQQQASYGGARFQKMLDMQWKFLQDAKETLDQVDAPKNTEWNSKEVVLQVICLTNQ